MRFGAGLLRLALLASLAVVFGIAAASGSSRSLISRGPRGVANAAAKFPPRLSAPRGAKRGGTLTVIASADVDYIDPGAAYYQPTYMVDYAVDSPLMGWPSRDSAAPVPLLAAAPPVLSNGGKTITFKIKRNIHYSPPLGGGPGWTKPVVAADVKYAIERGLLPGVPNGYETLYFADLVGLSQAEAAAARDPRRAPNISGIQTPNSSTVVLRLTKPSSIGVISALSLPLSSPVPEGYAAKFDAREPSTYGVHQIDVGPYYISRYAPGSRITLLRNPNYARGSDFRPAFLNKIVLVEGFRNTGSAVRRILTGSSMVNFDFGPNGASLALAATRYPKQLTLTPSGGTRYVALNTSKPPFNNINVRRAVIAAADRVAMVATRGGPLSGAVATHFIPPGVPGFQQAGGYGPPAGLDFMAHPSGDLSLAESYMKLAGYTSGMCTGSSCTVTMVNDDTPPGSDTAQVVKADLVALGFNVQSQPVGENVMYSRFCSVVANEPNICPNVGWVKDFNDGQAMIDVPFNGATTSSSPNYNSNWPQLNDPAVNSALDAAKLITSRPARAVRYGAIDDLIMADAPAIPWDWDYQANVSSANVIPVINDFNGLTDLSYTSLR